MRHAAIRKRRDVNEPDVIKALRAAGAFVTQISGEGAPDLLVRFRGRAYGLEVKGRTAVRTPAQEVSQWPVVRDAYEALAQIGAI